MNTTPETSPSSQPEPSPQPDADCDAAGATTAPAADRQNATGDSSQSPPPPMLEHAFFARIRSWGIMRRTERRWFAGVASGIADRWGYDPILVRGAFVALALFGVAPMLFLNLSGGSLAFLLYGLGWLLLPQRDGRIHAQAVLNGDFTAGFFGSVVLLILSFPSIRFGYHNGFSLFGIALWLGLIALIVYLVRNRKSLGSVPAGGGVQHNISPQTTESIAAPAQYQGAPSYPYSSRERTKPSRALTMATTGAALIIAAIAYVVADAAKWIMTPYVVAAAAATATIGIGMVIAGMLGRRSGGLLALAFLSAGLLIMGIGLHSAKGVSGETWLPLSNSDANAGRDIGAGSLTLDLTDPHSAGTAENPLQIPIHIGMGEIRLEVPADRTVMVKANVGAGEIINNVTGRNRDGAGLIINETIGSGKPLTIVNVQLGMGSLEIVPTNKPTKPKIANPATTPPASSAVTTSSSPNTSASPPTSPAATPVAP